MSGPAAPFEPVQKQPRTPSQAATLLLALFVFAAIPAVSVAQGLDAAILAEFVRESGRGMATREPGVTPRGLRAAVTIARGLRIHGERDASRPRVSAGRVLDLLAIAPDMNDAPCVAEHHVRSAWLGLPPPKA